MSDICTSSHIFNLSKKLKIAHRACLEACDKRTWKEIEPEFGPSIGVVEDKQGGTIGPLRVCGKIPIESADGTTYEVRNRVTLCRCGKSRNKPFCDSSHLRR